MGTERGTGGHTQHVGHNVAAERMPVLTDKQFGTDRQSIAKTMLILPVPRQFGVGQTQTEYGVGGAETGKVAFQLGRRLGAE